MARVRKAALSPSDCCPWVEGLAQLVGGGRSGQRPAAGAFAGVEVGVGRQLFADLERFGHVQIELPHEIEDAGMA